MSNLASLVVSLEANIARFEADMGKAASVADAAMKRIEASSALAASALKTMGGLVAGALAVSSLQSFAERVVASTAALKDMSEKTGATVENLSALRSVAAIGGRDFEAIGAAMNKLTKGLAGADEETKGAAQGLNAIGISVEKFQRLDPAEQMLKVAQQLDKFRDGSEKSAVAMALWGKAGADLLPFIKDLAEKGELQAKVTTAQAEEADKLEKNIRAIQKAQDDWKKKIVIDMLPALTDLSAAMREAQKAGGTLFSLFVGLGGLLSKSTLGQMFNLDGSDDARRKAEAQANAMQLLGLQIERFSKLAANGDQGAAARVVQLRAQLADLSREALKTTEQLKKVDETAAKVDTRPQIDTSTLRPKTSKAGGNEGDKFIESLKRQVEQQERGRFEMLRLEAAQKNVTRAAAPYIGLLEEAELRQGRIKRIVEEVAEAETQRSKITDLVTTGNDFAKSLQQQTQMVGLTEDAQRRLTEARKVDEALQKSMVGASSETRAELMRVAQVINNNVIAAYNELATKQRAWATGAATALQGYVDMASNAAKQSERLFSNAFQGIEDALVKFVQTGKLDFKSLADSIIADLARIYVQRQITLPLANWATGKASPGAGTGDDATDKLVGLSGSGSGFVDSVASLFGLGKNAVGMPYVPRDMLTMVHEGEKITPAGGAAGGAGVVIQQSMTFNGNADPATLAQWARQVRDSTLAEVSARMRSGSPAFSG